MVSFWRERLKNEKIYNSLIHSEDVILLKYHITFYPRKLRNSKQELQQINTNIKFKIMNTNETQAEQLPQDAVSGCFF